MPGAARRGFTVEECERIGEAAILAKAHRVDLVEGEMVRKPVIGSRDAGGVRRTDPVT